MNYMAEVAKLLGVELGEVFNITIKDNHDIGIKLTNDGIEIVNYIIVGTFKENVEDIILSKLLKGEVIIKRKSCKPKDDEMFYVILSDGDVRHKYWDDCATCKNYYKLGNCYYTKEEAEANRDKWLSFYASDEVLEV